VGEGNSVLPQRSSCSYCNWMAMSIMACGAEMGWIGVGDGIGSGGMLEQGPLILEWEYNLMAVGTVIPNRW
jgi:hypothetical protein